MIVRENNGEPPWESSLPATEKAYTIINKCKIKWEKGDFVYFILLKKNERSKAIFAEVIFQNLLLVKQI